MNLVNPINLFYDAARRGVVRPEKTEFLKPRRFAPSGASSFLEPEMAKLSTAARKSYPMPDKSHAANAKARASQAVNAGRMSASTEGKIDSKANKVLGEKPGRGERTETNKATRGDVQHPQSHDAWEKLGQ